MEYIERKIDSKLDNEIMLTAIKKIINCKLLCDSNWVDLITLDERPDNISLRVFYWRRNTIKEIIKDNKDKLRGFLQYD